MPQGILISMNSSRAPHIGSRPGPTQQPKDSSARKPQTKQPISYEHSPTHEKTGCLKSDWAHSHLTTYPLIWPCPSEEQAPSSTHQRATLVLPPESWHKPLDSLFHQGTDSRSKKNWNPAACKMEAAITERQNGMAEGYVPDEGARQNLHLKRFQSNDSKGGPNIRERLEAQTKKIQ